LAPTSHTLMAKQRRTGSRRGPQHGRRSTSSEAVRSRKAWDDFALLWARIGSRLIAKVQQDERARYYRLWDHRNQLVEMLNTTIALRGQRDFNHSLRSQYEACPHLRLLDELRAEIHRTQEEAAVYTDHGGLDTFRERAFDGESEEETARRILLEHGVTPYRLDPTRRQKTAERLVLQLRDLYQWYLDGAMSVLNALEKGQPIASTIAEPLTIDRARREIARLRAKIDALPLRASRGIGSRRLWTHEPY
jgi:hypothetical protein